MTLEKAEQALGGLADTLAHVLDPQNIALELTVDHVKSGALSTVFKIYLGGRQGLVKIYADSTDAAAAFDREKLALRGFQGGFVPKLLFVADQERALMTGFIQGKTLGETVTQETLLHDAGQLGQWAGTIHNAAPRKGCAGTWASYLEKYEHGFSRDILGQQSAALASVDTPHLALAHNDNALSNFILDRNDQLYGIDFAQARFKPEGWDMAMASRALFLKFPNDLQAISTAMHTGYQQTVKRSALPNHFDQIINIVAVAALLDTP